MNLNKKKISKLLDIGSAFLFIDQAVIYDKKKICITKTNIKKTHWTFSSHLLSKPIFPGALLIEIMCQTAMLNIYKKTNKIYNSTGFLSSVDIKFKNVIKKKMAPLIIQSEAKEISYNRGLSIYEVRTYSKNSKIVFADGKITHFIPINFLKKIGE